MPPVRKAARTSVCTGRRYQMALASGENKGACKRKIPPSRLAVHAESPFRARPCVHTQAKTFNGCPYRRAEPASKCGNARRVNVCSILWAQGRFAPPRTQPPRQSALPAQPRAAEVHWPPHEASRRQYGRIDQYMVNCRCATSRHAGNICVILSSASPPLRQRRGAYPLLRSTLVKQGVRDCAQTQVAALHEPSCQTSAALEPCIVAQAARIQPARITFLRGCHQLPRRQEGHRSGQPPQNSRSIALSRIDAQRRYMLIAPHHQLAPGNSDATSGMLHVSPYAASTAIIFAFKRARSKPDDPVGSAGAKVFMARM